MRCPFCGAQDTKVVDSRLAGDGDQVRRRRRCLSCDERFTTFETAELNLPRVIKQDGTRVPFDGTKLAAGMMRALEKRPVSTERIDAALTRRRDIYLRNRKTKTEDEAPNGDSTACRAGAARAESVSPQGRTG